MSTFDEFVTTEQKNERLERLREWAKLVADRFEPEKIILFGSYAYGNPTGHSDADVLVVMSTDLQGTEQAAAITKLYPQPFAMDLLVRTPETLRQRVELGDFFLREITNRGITLYESSDE